MYNIYIYIYIIYIGITHIYIYIYIYLFTSSRKRPDVLFYGFHRRESRGPVAAGNHNKRNDGNHQTTFSCHDGNHEKSQRRKPILKTKKTRNRLIRSKIMDPPAAAESTKNPATETINKRNGNHNKNVTETINKNQRRKPVLTTQQKTRNRSICSQIMDPPAAAESTKNPATETINKRFPATTETIKRKPKTETIKKFPATTETIQKPTTETVTKRWMLSTTGKVKKRPDGFRDELSMYIYIYICIYREREREKERERKRDQA